MNLLATIDVSSPTFWQGAMFGMALAGLAAQLKFPGLAAAANRLLLSAMRSLGRVAGRAGLGSRRAS